MKHYRGESVQNVNVGQRLALLAAGSLVVSAAAIVGVVLFIAGLRSDSLSMKAVLLFLSLSAVLILLGVTAARMAVPKPSRAESKTERKGWFGSKRRALKALAFAVVCAPLLPGLWFYFAEELKDGTWSEDRQVIAFIAVTVVITYALILLAAYFPKPRDDDKHVPKMRR